MDYKNQSIDNRLGPGNAKISRRQFLKDVALVLSGAAVVSGLSCCLNKPESYEDQIYGVIKKSITENKPSDMAVFRDNGSVTYCSKGVETLLEGIRELDKGRYPQKWPSQSFIPHELTEILDSEGFYVTLKNPENLDNNIDIEFAYLNHPELKNVAFSFKKNGDKVEIALGKGCDYVVVYKKDNETVKRFLVDPNLDLPFEKIIVDEKKIERYYDLVKKIQENFTTPSHKKE